MLLPTALASPTPPSGSGSHTSASSFPFLQPHPFRPFSSSSARRLLLLLPGRGSTRKMVQPVKVSPLIKLTRYSFLVLGMVYGAKRYAYLKPRAEAERKLAAEKKKKEEEIRKIQQRLEEARGDSILK
ncbi:ATP synthase subunit e, mitochondrial isoform X1 [Gracilinanus agilis]|uniref:ATP synthase subunit e, mitochondrial isoform X1 n=1 Tax=Gracilinanus agilis TaxID=191870 RepID=UPI001CFDEA62|nr:ATP synthase subunit e, mitochondrial isoform X1 [Gracilinanus agilis]